MTSDTKLAGKLKLNQIKLTAPTAKQYAAARDTPPAEICCVVPFWSQSDGMNWDSNYAYLKIVLPKLKELLPNWLFVVLWPKHSYGQDKWVWMGDGFWSETDGIVRYPWPYDTAVRTGAIGFDPQEFQKLDETIAPTIYWCHQVEMATFIGSGYRQSYSKPAIPSIVAQHHYIIHKSLPYPMHSMFSRMWLQLGGAQQAHINVFNSDHCRRMFDETLADHAATQIIDSIVSKCRTHRFGLVTSEHCGMYIRHNEFNPVVLYNHRFENYKNPHKTAAAINAVKNSGRKLEVWVTQTEGQKMNLLPVDRIVGDPSRDKYLLNCAVPAINVCNSQHETFCISMLDSIALGHLPLAPNAVTFPELVPQGYPYLFNSEKEQVHMLAHLVDHFKEEYDKWSPVLREHARKNFSLDRYAQTYANTLQEAGARWHDANVKEHTAEGLDTYFSELQPGRYKLADIARTLRSHLGMASQSFPERRIVREFSIRGGRFLWEANQLLLLWRK